MSHKENTIPASSTELFQGHGDHINALMDPDVFVEKHLRDVLKKSTRVQAVRTLALLEDPEPYITTTTSLRYGDVSFGLLSIIAADKDNKSNQLVSAFPYYYGKKLRVQIEKVWVWDNLLEATVRCSYKGFVFGFFAADYYDHQFDYCPGNEVEIQIGAMGMYVEEGNHGFSFEGQQAVDWLAKLGREPDYDENGQVMPVNFNTENMVAFLPVDERRPDSASFQSPAGEFRERSLMGIDFFETEVIIHRHDETVTIPFIFRKDCVPNAHKGMPLRGTLWIVGSF